MMNANAMDDGCLSMVSVGRCFRVHNALYNTPESASRRNVRPRRRKLCDEVGALELFYGRLARVGNTSRAQAYRAYRLLPIVFILLVESRNRARRELQRLVVRQRRLRRSWAGQYGKVCETSTSPIMTSCILIVPSVKPCGVQLKPHGDGGGSDISERLGPCGSVTRPWEGGAKGRVGCIV